MSEKIGILLATSPENENTHTVICLAETALADGKQVEIFLMCDGVYHLNDARLEGLTQKGAKVVVCAQNCLERKVERKPFVLWGSQYDLALLMKESDRFFSFN